MFFTKLPHTHDIAVSLRMCKAILPSAILCICVCTGTLASVQLVFRLSTPIGRYAKVIFAVFGLSMSCFYLRDSFRISLKCTL